MHYCSNRIVAQQKAQVNRTKTNGLLAIGDADIVAICALCPLAIALSRFDELVVCTANNNLAAAPDLTHHHALCDTLENGTPRHTCNVNVDESNVLDTATEVARHLASFSTPAVTNNSVNRLAVLVIASSPSILTAGDGCTEILRQVTDGTDRGGREMGANVTGLALGFVFWVKLSAWLWSVLETMSDVVTMSRDALLALLTRVDFLLDRDVLATIGRKGNLDGLLHTFGTRLDPFIFHHLIAVGQFSEDTAIFLVDKNDSTGTVCALAALSIILPRSVVSWVSQKCRHLPEHRAESWQEGIRYA
ncbi:hypothetical protein HG531_006949 [Fusarium graminearum]|nr:hypothetical protein HG531_006949 [Fusarium graminearum]